MQSLGVILRNRGEEGDPLPAVIPVLDRAGAKFRRGQLSLIAAAPGGGKSALASHFAVNGTYDEFTGIPTLYVSADTDRMTIGSRVVMGVLGVGQEDAEHLVGTEDPAAFAAFEAATNHIWWSFQPSPSLRDIDDEVKAYGYALGGWPHLIVVDNLMDVNHPGEEYSRYRDIIMFLVELARMTGAHVMLLHHVVGQYTDGNAPIPRSGIRQKVDEKPRLILTLYNVDDTTMGIRVVKNTNGPASAAGGYGVDIPWLKERSWFGG